MKIHNFRVGFATNSSSSHSIVMIPPELVGTVKGIYDGPTDSYGWDWFRLVTEEDKMRYLAAQFITKFVTSDGDRDLIVERFEQEVPGMFDGYDLVGTEKSYTSGGQTHTYMDRSYPSIDHQSVFGLNYVDGPLMDRMIDFFKSPRVVVLGGNDNCDEDDHLLNAVPGADPLKVFNAMMTDGRDIRLKVEGPYWSLFDPSNGTKTRMSLDTECPDYEKSITPELVDLKITDYCGRGCNFCYQASTTEGLHGSYDDIVRVLDMLSEMNVFEVAIGGGEPTDHPDFARIIRAANDRKIIPNFTTLSDRWLLDDDIMAAVGEFVGGIGVSCSDAKALALVEKIKKNVHAKRPSGRWNGPVISAQHVLGAVPLTVTADFLEKAFESRIPVLLLGFKEVGFGADYARHDDSTTEVVLKLALSNAQQNYHWPQLSVDTALVDQYPDLMSAIGVPEALITSPEGKFSCYVDAVERTMGPSSYIEKVAMNPLAADTEAFKTVYAGY